VGTRRSLARARWLVLPACAAAFMVLGLAPVQADAAAVHVPVSASAPHVKQIPEIIEPGWYFTGDTYPVTAAGGAACEDEGKYIVEHTSFTTYQCRLDDPYENKINLWVYGIDQ
jgi:hypothetical protein